MQGIRSAESSSLFLDTSGDGYLTPRDALLVINYLNQLLGAPIAAPLAAMIGDWQAPETIVLETMQCLAEPAASLNLASAPLAAADWTANGTSSSDPAAAKATLTDAVLSTGGDAADGLADWLVDASHAETEDWFAGDRAETLADDDLLSDELSEIVDELAATWGSAG
jgi:hypothetical protein